MRDRPSRPRWALAVHGGAGTVRRQDLAPEGERAYRAALERPLAAGGAGLAGGRGAADARGGAPPPRRPPPPRAAHRAWRAGRGGPVPWRACVGSATRSAWRAW